MRDIVLKNGYSVRRLGKDAYTAVLDLCVSCSDYYLLHCGVSPAKREVDEIFLDLPPDKGYEDKFVLGVFDAEDMLVGILDVIRDYVIKGEWTIGLMLLDPKQRGKGLGTIVHETLVVWAVELGAKSFRLGAIKKNPQGLAFWSSLGYEKIKEVEMTLTEKTHIVNVMTLHFTE